ncbi:toll/interleukin-1 receptor domain-containing protein [Variovorax sp. J22P271]|uniref:toll/interleukin-1 receptor domain-containing protein n=1 Tax=Variovorax davisae TaxID=3053515 RepID=UPI0025750B7C|nr:toll/interleukin-1 receptor domain-containing protein [Variovorax sp. J22P271]MDM0032827.1 toll/interleukin-1 receptor domain-containing protein [Variovorax sp. J22P271]
MTHAIFLSYRRVESGGWAGRLESDLATTFGDAARFIDLHSIAPGADFRDAIEQGLVGAAAVLVLIGPRWLDLRNDRGERRIDGTEDVVADEVEKALGLDVAVIPVLLGGAVMPASSDLPPRLKPLARRNAIELSDARWPYDLERLLAALETATSLRRLPGAVGSGAVSVGSGLRMSDAEAGNVIGVRGALPPGGVDVLSGAGLSRVKLGDIVGVEIAPLRPKEPRE